MDKAVLERVRKLLALGQSSNPHEAAAAMGHAQKLMREHGISDADLRLADFERSAAGRPVGKRPAHYIAVLAFLVADTFGCRMMLSSDRRMSFYGVAARVDLSIYAFVVLQRQLATARRAYLATQSKRLKRSTLVARADNFAAGWVYSCQVLLQAMALSSHELALLDAFEQTFGALSSVSTRSAGNARQADGEAYRQGRKEGRSARLDRGLSEAPRQIAG